MKKDKLIVRLYRVTEKQDKFIKKQAKLKGSGESQYVRSMIEYFILLQD